MRFHKSWLASPHVIYCCKLCIITSVTVAGAENWHKGYGQMQMWDKSSCDFFLFSGKKEKMEMAQGWNKSQAPRQSLSLLQCKFKHRQNSAWAVGGQMKTLLHLWTPVRIQGKDLHISEGILPSKALTLGKGERKQFARGLFAVTLVKYKPKKGIQYKKALAQQGWSACQILLLHLLGWLQGLG